MESEIRLSRESFHVESQKAAGDASNQNVISKI